MDISLLAAYGVGEDIIKLWRRSFPRLLPIQVRAITEFGLFSGQNILIFAPTSSGKTFVGEMAAVKVAKENKRAFFLLPLKSLAEEKYEEFRTRYSSLGLKVVVSSRDRREYDRSIESGEFDIAIVVFEKMDSLLVAKPTLLEKIGLVVVDEMQMLSDPSRGPRLELLLAKILAFAKGSQIIGLSAVLEKSQKIRDWVGARLLQDRTRPVELRKGVFCHGTFYYVLHNAGTPGQEHFNVPSQGSIADATIRLVAELTQRGEQCLIFLRDKRSAISLATRFASQSRHSPAEQTISSLRGLSDETPSTDLLVSLLANGVAFHNADLDYHQRTAIEKGFRHGEIAALFSTSTLAMGMNLPAKNVIIDSKRWHFSEQFQQMHVVDISRGEYENLSGRAGRLSLEPEFGRSILVTSSEFEVKRLTDKYVTGSFEEARPMLDRMPLEDVVLSLLASRLVQTEEQLCNFLLSTYTGRNLWVDRSARSAASDEHRFRRRLAESIELLADWGLLARKGSRIILSDLGSAVSQACILAKTGLAFAQWARANRRREAPALEVLLLIASSKDAASTFVPLSRSEWQTDRYLDLLKQVARENNCLRKPLVSELLDAKQRPSFERTRAIKRALLMLDWVSEVSLKELEEKYRVWPGLVRRIGETDSWLCEALTQICQLYNWPRPALAGLSSLTNRLSFGLLDDAVALARHLSRKLCRSKIRALVDDGITSQARLRKAPSEHLVELVGYEAALAIGRGRLRKPTRPRPPRPEAPAQAETHKPDEEHSARPVLAIDKRNLTVRYKDLQATLTPKAFKLLELLARRAPQFVHKEEIYQALWGSTDPDLLPYERQIADHKGRLLRTLVQAARRSKLVSPHQVRELIISKYGVGYRLALDAEAIEILD